MEKKVNEHWATKALNRSCFETGKILSKGRRWISGAESKDEPEEEKKAATGMLDTLTEKAENIVENVKKSFLGIGESFKSGYAESPRSVKQSEVSKEKKTVKRSRPARPAARVSRPKTEENLPESTAKIRRRVEDEPLSSESSQEISDETAEGQEGASDDSHPQSALRPETPEAESFASENEDLEREIEKVTEYLPDIGDANRKTL